GGFWNGSGGGIRVDVTTLSGAGSMSASSANYGGGGRIAVYYGSSTFNFATKVRAQGYPGGAGTIYTKSPTQTNGELRVDNGGNAQGGTTRPTPVLGGTYDQLVIGGNAVVQLGGPIIAPMSPIFGTVGFPAGTVLTGAAGSAWSVRGNVTFLGDFTLPT